jgi:D-xylose transport system substrate-binding protein
MAHERFDQSEIPRLRDLLSNSTSRRRFLQAGVGAAITTVLAACGLGGTPSSSLSPGASLAGPRKKVALILPTYTQARWQAADQPYFEQEAARQNLDVIVQVSNNDDALQASQVENVLTQGIDVLVLGSVNADSAKGMVAKAQAANVPVIAYNYIIQDQPLAAIISRDAKQVGLEIGKAAIAAVPEGNYINAFGDQGNSVGAQKGEGNLEAIQPLVDSGAIKVVSQQWNVNFDPALVQKQVENALTANNNNIQAIFATADVMAYGAIAALEAQGLAGKVWVGGEDAEIKALKLIQEGSLSATSFTPFDQMGIEAAKAAAAVANGQTVEAAKTLDNGFGDIPWVQIDVFNVDKTNLADFVQNYGWWLEANGSSAADLGF